MIKLLEDLLIEATTNANVPGSIVAGLRKAVDAARASALPPPFDSMEEAQRAAGCVPTAAASYRVCIRDSQMGKVGQVMFIGNVPDSAYPSHADWLPCDKDGWVSGNLSSLPGLDVEWRDHPGLSDWRPTRATQFVCTTGHVDAIPKSSAIDEMAEQIRRWAVPTREDAATAPALAVQEGGSHYKDMKIQPVEYIHANSLGYFEGNVVKYVSRWRAKGGLQDLKKARHYLDLLIELEGDTK